MNIFDARGALIETLSYRDGDPFLVRELPDGSTTMVFVAGEEVAQRRCKQVRLAGEIDLSCH